MASVNDRHVELDTMGWLGDAPPAFRADLLRRCDKLSFRQGEPVFRAEDSTGGIFGVVSGRLDLHLPTLRAGRTLLHACGPGWWLGELAALSGRPRRFDLLAGRETSILRLSRAELSRLCEDRPETWRYLTVMITANQRLAIDAVESLRLDDPEARVAACLVRLHATGTGWNGHLPCSQTELASMADLSRRRVIAALESLERHGWIKRGYGIVFVNDPKKLLSRFDP